jgi:hypothetical protein
MKSLPLGYTSHKQRTAATAGDANADDYGGERKWRTEKFEIHSKSKENIQNYTSF